MSGREALYVGYGVAASASLAVFLLYVILQGSKEVIATASNVIFVVVAWASTAVALWCSSRYWVEPRLRFSTIWLLISASMVLDALGETVWAWYVLVLGMEVPYPSVADVFYLLSYPPIILGLYLYVEMFKEVVPRKRVARVVAALVAAGLVISYFTIIGYISGG